MVPALHAVKRLAKPHEVRNEGGVGRLSQPALERRPIGLVQSDRKAAAQVLDSGRVFHSIMFQLDRKPV
jgi:hypothetical protein